MVGQRGENLNFALNLIQHSGMDRQKKGMTVNLVKPTNISLVDGQTNRWRDKLTIYGLSRAYMNIWVFVRISSFTNKSCSAYKT